MEKKVRWILCVVIVLGWFPGMSIVVGAEPQPSAASGSSALAVGRTILNAARAVYATQQAQLIALLNGVVATGDEQAVRYAMVAILMAGGVENLEQAKTVINASDVPREYPGLTSLVTLVEALMRATPESAQDGFVDPVLQGPDLENLFASDLDHDATPD